MSNIKILQYRVHVHMYVVILYIKGLNIFGLPKNFYHFKNHLFLKIYFDYVFKK